MFCRLLLWFRLTELYVLGLRLWASIIIDNNRLRVFEGLWFNDPRFIDLFFSHSELMAVCNRKLYSADCKQIVRQTVEARMHYFIIHA
jgi:hypothetical protein